MAPTIGFLAYGSKPSMVGQEIEHALRLYAQRHGHGKFGSWVESDVAGRFIAADVLEKIMSSRCLIADISIPNFNVTYEVCYAIGRCQRTLSVINRSVERDEAEFRRVEIFDTLGYKTYENASELCAILEGVDEFSPIRFSMQINTSAPVWILQLPFNTEAQGRLIARVKKARLQFRSFDPAEQSRLSATDAIDGIAASHGVVIPLAPIAMADCKTHNLRAAFAAGLSHGMGKATLILQSGDNPVPIDFRDFVQSYRHPNQIDDYVAHPK